MTGAPLRLVFSIDGAQLGALVAPEDFGSRAWTLSVVALQASADRNGVRAQLRAHQTGLPRAETWPLESGSRLDVALTNQQVRCPPLPPFQPAARAAIALYEEAAPAASVTLDELPAHPLRAFGHVFCRFLREGGYEAGFDLTEFLAPPRGHKYERTVSRPLVPGRTVSFMFWTR